MHLKINFKNDPLLLLPPKICLTAHYSCQKQNVTTDDPIHWMEVTNYVCYVTLPVVLFFSIVGQVINIVMFIKQIRLSMDTYLLGLSIASLFLVFSTIAISLQYYVGYYEVLVLVQSYAILCRDCFWYTSLWLLVLMSLERSLSVSITNNSQSLCTSAQALIVVVLVFCIGFVSALPRFWEYQVERLYDSKANTTALVLQKSMVANIPEYNSIYYWYGKIITIFLPYPLMLFICTALCCSTRAEAIEQREIPDKHVTSTAMIINRRELEETDLTKLVIFLIIAYIILCGPFNILELLSSPMVNLLNQDDLLIVTLQNIFTICFYIYYLIHQQLYFCYNKQFRLTLLSMCCCCC